jgi:hypothetical protein
MSVSAYSRAGDEARDAYGGDGDGSSHGVWRGCGGYESKERAEHEEGDRGHAREHGERTFKCYLGGSLGDELEHPLRAVSLFILA